MDKHYIFTRPSLPLTFQKFRDLEYSYINCKKKGRSSFEITTMKSYGYTNPAALVCET